jgi:8-oxo-dGTP pyrophosphatase MutT (NUDIX family)
MEKILKKLIDKMSSEPRILGNRNYVKSVVLIPLVLIKDEYHIIFEKRANGIRQGGEISFPGGGFDAQHDESYQATAIRETCEELGLKQEDIKVHKQFDTVVVPHGNMIFTFLGEISQKTFEKIKVNHHEVDYIFTIPLKHFQNNEPEVYQTRSQMFPFKIDENGNEIITFPAKDLGVPDKYSNPWGNKLYPVYVYRVNNEVIWGITGQIIYELVSLLSS